VGVLVIMDLDGQIKLGHLLLNDRKCRVCGEVKNLIDGFYRTRKDRGQVPSSYSYECKDCTIKRIIVSRMSSKILDRWEYPDW
jgi:hypothetical protein